MFFPKTTATIKYWTKHWGKYATARSLNGIALLVLVNMVSIPVVSRAGAVQHQELAVAETSMTHHASMHAGRSRLPVIVTAYSSTEDQTDDTPWITASGMEVGDGVVAANFLPFGTKIKIPKLFGDKIFVVKDRMAKRFSDRVDVWVHDRIAAKRIGVQSAEIIVL